MRKVDTLVVDKTWTLTGGKPKLVALKPAPGFDEVRLLPLAASLERASEHPPCRCHRGGSGIAWHTVPRRRELWTGKGVKARVEGLGVLLGNGRLMEDSGASPASLATEAQAMRADGQTVMFVAVHGKRRADRGRRPD